MLFGISPLQCLYASVPAGRHKGKQTDRQAGELAGGQECLPVRKSENGQAGNYVFFTCVAAFGAVVAACGVFEPYFRLGKHPTFAPKRQGKAESAHRRPRLRPSFGQQKGIGRPMPYKWVMAGLSPIRLPRIFVSSKTQVTQRVSGYSRNDLAPHGEGFLSEVGKPVSTCGAVAEATLMP